MREVMFAVSGQTVIVSRAGKIRLDQFRASGVFNESTENILYFIAQAFCRPQILFFFESRELFEQFFLLAAEF